MNYLILVKISICYFRLSNTNEAGVWLFRVGDISPEGNAEEPDVRQIMSPQGRSSHCKCLLGTLHHITNLYISCTHHHFCSIAVMINAGDKTCATMYTLCHSQATCIDSAQKSCCVCRKGFYGNGFSCLKDRKDRSKNICYCNMNKYKIIQVTCVLRVIMISQRHQ